MTGSGKTISVRGIVSAAALAVALCLGASGLHGGALAQDFTMKIDGATMNGVQHEWMKAFETRIEKRSGGRIEAKLFPSGYTAWYPGMIAEMEIGSVESLVMPAAFLAGLDRRNSVLNTPGLFRDIDHCWKTFADQEFRDVWFPLMEDKGLLTIAILCAAPQAFLTKKKIDRLDDFKGLKIRVRASDLELKPMRAMGIEPTPMPFGKVLPGLQGGLIDGVSAIPILFVKLKMYNAARYITTTNLIHFGVPIYVRKPWFDKLPGDLQKIVFEEARAAERAVVDWNDDANAKILEDWKARGGTVTALPAADQARLVSTVRAAASKVLASQPQVNALYKTIDAIVKRY